MKITNEWIYNRFKKQEHEYSKASQIDCCAENTVTRISGDRLFFDLVFDEKYKSSMVSRSSKWFNKTIISGVDYIFDFSKKKKKIEMLWL